MRTFLQASQEVRFQATRRQEIYEWVTRTICYQEYWKQKRGVKGLLRQYIAAMTGLRRAQVTRLIARYKEDGQVQERGYRRNRFARQYTGADIELLGTVDEAHGTLSGPATQKILYRGFYEYGDERYRRLAAISVPHIYNLRKTPAYRKRRIAYQKTRPAWREMYGIKADHWTYEDVILAQYGKETFENIILRLFNLIYPDYVLYINDEMNAPAHQVLGFMLYMLEFEGTLEAERIGKKFIWAHNGENV